MPARHIADLKIILLPPKKGALKLERLERYVGAASPGVAANRDMTGARPAARRAAYTTMQGLGPRAGVFHSREDRRGWR